MLEVTTQPIEPEPQRKNRLGQKRQPAPGIWALSDINPQIGALGSRATAAEPSAVEPSAAVQKCYWGNVVTVQQCNGAEVARSSSAIGAFECLFVRTVPDTTWQDPSFFEHGEQR